MSHSVRDWIRGQGRPIATPTDYDLDAIRLLLTQQGDWLRKKYPSIARKAERLHGVDRCRRGHSDWSYYDVDGVQKRCCRLCRNERDRRSWPARSRAQKRRRLKKLYREAP